MATFKQIIDNQQKYKTLIIDYLLKEYDENKKILSKIETDDKYIISEKEKLSKKFKKVDVDKIINKLFFTCPTRNKDFYVWWDEKNEQAKILKYGKRQEKHRFLRS